MHKAVVNTRACSSGKAPAAIMKIPCREQGLGDRRKGEGAIYGEPCGPY